VGSAPQQDTDTMITIKIVITAIIMETITMTTMTIITTISKKQTENISS
jgi:hypothetical protein